MYHKRYNTYILFVCISFSLIAQSRIGSINKYSSEAECREYFKRNISDLDPIEGIYQTETFSQQTNRYNNFPIEKLGTSKITIYKEDNGIFRASNNLTITRIGETMFYNYIIDWKDAGGITSTTRFSFNGTTFDVTHEIPQSVIKKNLNQNNANTKIFIKENYIKEYPTYSMYQEGARTPIEHPKEIKAWSGTGFALKDGYIATNYHIVENAKTVQVKGIKGNLSIKYNASIVAFDKNNDLAVLRISDNKFNGFGNIPYNIKTALSEVGEDIFVLGYPLTSTMGDEIKLTTGIISSKTGFQGNISLYQISAPIQPGNSGAPLFDHNGHLVGIVSGKHKGAESVGYAIKTSYLKNLVESSISNLILPNSNQIAGISLTNKVKRIKDYIFQIECSNSFLSNESILTNKKSNSDIDIINPSISIIPNQTENLKIKRVRVTLAQTIIDLEYDNSTSGSGWVTISPNTYIISYNTGKKYTLVKTEGIPVEPQKYYFSSRFEKLQFKLIFPSLPQNTTKFNLIESESSPWKFYGIKLK